MPYRDTSREAWDRFLTSKADAEVDYAILSALDTRETVEVRNRRTGLAIRYDTGCEYGCTSHELEVRTGIRLETISGNTAHLVAAGIIVRTVLRRYLPSGNYGAVLVAVCHWNEEYHGDASAPSTPNVRPSAVYRNYQRGMRTFFNGQPLVSENRSYQDGYAAAREWARRRTNSYVMSRCGRLPTEDELRE